MRLNIVPLQVMAVEDEPFPMKVLHYAPWLIAALLAVLPVLVGLIFVFLVGVMAFVVAKILEFPYLALRWIFRRAGLAYRVKTNVVSPPPEDF